MTQTASWTPRPSPCRPARYPPRRRTASSARHRRERPRHPWPHRAVHRLPGSTVSTRTSTRPARTAPSPCGLDGQPGVPPGVLTIAASVLGDTAQVRDTATLVLDSTTLTLESGAASIQLATRRQGHGHDLSGPVVAGRSVRFVVTRGATELYRRTVTTGSKGVADRLAEFGSSRCGPASSRCWPSCSTRPDRPSSLGLGDQDDRRRPRAHRPRGPEPAGRASGTDVRRDDSGVGNGERHLRRRSVLPGYVQLPGDGRERDVHAARRVVDPDPDDPQRGDGKATVPATTQITAGTTVGSLVPRSAPRAPSTGRSRSPRSTARRPSCRRPRVLRRRPPRARRR